jgi:hypothetical protein
VALLFSFFINLAVVAVNAEKFYSYVRMPADRPLCHANT